MLRSPSAQASPRFRLHMELVGRDDASQTLELLAYIADVAVTLDGTPGTWSLLNSAGAVVLTSAVTGVSGGGTVALTSSSTSALALGEGYRSRWTVKQAGTGTIYVFEQGACVVARRLYPDIISADLRAKQSDLDRYLPIDPETGVRQTTWNPQITAAWWEIQAEMLKNARRPWLSIEPAAFRLCHTFWTLANIYRGTPGIGGGSVDAVTTADYYEDKAKDEFNSLRYEEVPEEMGEQVARVSPRRVTVFIDPSRMPSY